MALAAVSAPALAFVYGVAVLWAVRRVRAGRRGMLERVLAWLRSAGRMSLTNYMGESLLAGTLVGGWGLGLFGKLGPAACLAITPVLFGVLVAFSAAWLRAFRYGPEERLLRCWTKGRWEPFRVAPSVEVPSGPPATSPLTDAPRAPAGILSPETPSPTEAPSA